MVFLSTNGRLASYGRWTKSNALEKLPIAYAIYRLTESYIKQPRSSIFHEHMLSRCG